MAVLSSDIKQVTYEDTDEWAGAGAKQSAVDREHGVRGEVVDVRGLGRQEAAAEEKTDGSTAETPDSIRAETASHFEWVDPLFRCRCESSAFLCILEILQ